MTSRHPDDHRAAYETSGRRYAPHGDPLGPRPVFRVTTNGWAEDEDDDVYASEREHE